LTDRIFVDNLRVPCRVGLTPAERGEPQEIVVDVSIFLSLARAARGDEVKDSVNYRDVKERISAFATGRKFSLLETVAEGIAGALLDSFPVERVSVKVRKAKYSKEPSIGVEIVRERESWSSR
jgi:dihydroneopterin aldolase